MIVYFNGNFVPEAEAVVPINDRGLLYGDGLFETIRVSHGQPFRLAQHLERFQRGADFLKIVSPLKTKEIHKVVAEFMTKNDVKNGIMRMTMTRGAGERGYTPGPDSQPLFAITIQATPEKNPQAAASWSMVTSAHQVPANDVVAAFKTTDKLLHVLARAEARERGADEALLLNSNGEVAEAAGGNIFWIFQNRVCTVPTGRGVLPGITRAVVLEACQILGIETNKRVIKPQQLQKSEGIFLTQSIHGVVAVHELDGLPITPSPLVEQIATTYDKIVQKECERRA